MLDELLAEVVGDERARALLEDVAVPDALLGREPRRGRVGRAAVAMALNLALLDDLLGRVPSAAAYLARRRGQGRRLVFDHGAVRTVAGPDTGGLPSGVECLRRFLVPLGYDEVGVYPLDRLRMTGKVFCHRDRPEDVPQLFVSELHVDQLPAPARDAVARVVGDSRDPLTDEARTGLDALAATGSLPPAAAADLVRALVPCLGRNHDDPALADYELLLEHSAEMAWIATEGNAFNHATDRVADDLETLSAELSGAGFAVKDAVERSTTGRVRQTALRADPVTRRFRLGGADGATVERVVPGSFFELINRDRLAGGGLDLSFDTGNAQGIFTMTRAR
jgi:hypothetical protein